MSDPDVPRLVAQAHAIGETLRSVGSENVSLAEGVRLLAIRATDAERGIKYRDGEWDTLRELLHENPGDLIETDAVIPAVEALQKQVDDVLREMQERVKNLKAEAERATDAAYARGADEMRERAAKAERENERALKFGVIELHPQTALHERFYAVVDDLRAAGAIVDLWLMDIATVLREYGYTMTIRQRALPSAPDGPSPSPEVK